MNKLEQTILRWLPLFGPVPIAWTVYHATTTLMNWPWWVAFAAALFIEGIGFSSINLAVRMRQFNTRLWEKERGKYTAPTRYAIAATAMYAFTALLLAVLLEIVPSLRVWSPTSFILMSVTGGFLYSLYSDQERRESEHSDAQRRSKLAQLRRQRCRQRESIAVYVAKSIPIAISTAGILGSARAIEVKRLGS